MEQESTQENKLHMSIAELTLHCTEEMARYQRRQPYDPRYCHELFRCALVERDDEAWAALYNQYHRLVRHWLGNVLADSDALVNQAFERFWHAFPPGRFVDFPTLDKILAYLKRCARGVAVDARRREVRQGIEEATLARVQEAAAEERDGLSEQVADRIVGEKLYECAMKRLHGPQERLVFCASFEWNLRPEIIVMTWPDTFANVQEVSRIKERILRRLRRNEELRALLEMNGEDGETEL